VDGEIGSFIGRKGGQMEVERQSGRIRQQDL
jgi:hypothetical protein